MDAEQLGALIGERDSIAHTVSSHVKVAVVYLHTEGNRVRIVSLYPPFGRTVV